MAAKVALAASISATSMTIWSRALTNMSFTISTQLLSFSSLKTLSRRLTCFYMRCSHSFFTRFNNASGGTPLRCMHVEVCFTQAGVNFHLYNRNFARCLSVYRNEQCKKNHSNPLSQKQPALHRQQRVNFFYFATSAKKVAFST